MDYVKIEDAVSIGFENLPEETFIVSSATELRNHLKFIAKVVKEKGCAVGVSHYRDQVMLISQWPTTDEAENTPEPTVDGAEPVADVADLLPGSPQE